MYVHLQRLLLLTIFICSSLVFDASALYQSQPSQRTPSRESQSSARNRRLRPPDSIRCPRNNLTSFTGRVLYYHRNATRTIIRMRTDEETTGKFTLHHSKDNDPTKLFLTKGEPFKESDWTLIESTRNRLRPNMRATVWVCDDGSNPIIDWRPSDKGNSKYVVKIPSATSQTNLR